MAAKPETVGEYIKNYPLDVRKRLQQIRQIVHKSVPKAQEAIKYGMPTFVLNGRNMLGFAAYKNHIAVYAIPPAGAALKKQLAPYAAHRSTLQFPLDQPLPVSLIRKVALAHAKRVHQRPKKAAKRPR